MLLGMPTHEEPYMRSVSATWLLDTRKISSGRRKAIDQRPAGPPTSTYALRDARKPLTVTVRYRGGSEAWWELSARGKAFRFPGHLCLHDVMAILNTYKAHVDGKALPPG